MCLNLKCGEFCAFDIEPVEILEQSVILYLLCEKTVGYQNDTNGEAISW